MILFVLGFVLSLATEVEDMEFMTHCQYWSVQGLSFGYLVIRFYLLTSP